MSQEYVQDLVDVLKALANESRLRILGHAAQRERSVKELADLLGLREPTVSHHLAKLRDHGLVSMRADGTTHYYRMNRDVFQNLNRELLSHGQVERISKEASVNAYERKVLKSFLEQDSLVEIPASRKKRQVILRWLAEKFDRDREYGPQELNRVLKRHHPDAATLRRELIASGLLRRDRDMYVRVG